MWKNDLDPVLTKILIKERENSGQLVDCGICDADELKSHLFLVHFFCFIFSYI